MLAALDDADRLRFETACKEHYAAVYPPDDDGVTTLPFHRHPEIEQSLVLEGSFYDHDGIARAGDFVWRQPHSKHETRSDEGCVILAVYRKPNVFRNSAGFTPG